jgi:hypothetical protein
MSSPPRGAVPTRIIRRKIDGRSRTICCATIPPSENPRTSQLSSPNPSRKSSACDAIPAIVVGTLPVDRPTPALSNKMTSRPIASVGRRADLRLIAVDEIRDDEEDDELDAARASQAFPKGGAVYAGGRGHGCSGCAHIDLLSKLTVKSAACRRRSIGQVPGSDGITAEGRRPYQLHHRIARTLPLMTGWAPTLSTCNRAQSTRF